LIHADLRLDDNDAFARMVPTYLAHADIVGASADSTRLQLDAVPRLPIISGRRTRALFAEAGLSEPFEVFRSLWYSCWTSSRAAR